MTNFNHEQLGKYSSSNEFFLDSEKGIAYAKATNDPTPMHLDGSYMPPIYGVVPVWEKIFETLNTIVPPEHFFSVVHGEQDMIWHKPLKSGMTLVSKGIGQSIAVKNSGTTLVIKGESHDLATGDMVLEQYFTMFFRGVHGGDFEKGFVGEKHETDLDNEEYFQDYEQSILSEDEQIRIFTKDTMMDEDQTYRYADASGDRMPIHTDDAFARSVGLDGIIIHGLCTMANASSVIIEGHCESDSTRLKRMSLRFAHPLKPGDEIRTSLFHSAMNLPQIISNGGYSHYFQTIRKSDGVEILSKGLAYVE